MQEGKTTQSPLGVPSMPESEGLNNPDRTSDPTMDHSPPLHERSGRLTTDKIPFDQLAPLDYDKSILFFGVVPMFVAGLLLVSCVALYFYRRGKQWNELGPAMRLDDPTDTTLPSQDFARAQTPQRPSIPPAEPLSEVDEAIKKTKRIH